MPVRKVSAREVLGGTRFVILPGDPSIKSGFEKLSQRGAAAASGVGDIEGDGSVPKRTNNSRDQAENS